MLSIIVAVDSELGIGKDNWMPWNLPEDLKQFKERTLGHKIIMGYTTFSGLPGALKNRHTYVINQELLESSDNVTYINNLNKFISEVKDVEEEYFVCGGSSIYRQMLPHCKKMYISHVDGVYPADTYFPIFEFSDWEIINERKYDGFIMKEYRRK